MDLFKEITPKLDQNLYAGQILPTSDKGVLVSLKSDVSTDPSNFRFLKLDSKGNAGWIGTFSSVGYDGLSGFTERQTGEVVFLTDYGYLAGIQPVY